MIKKIRRLLHFFLAWSAYWFYGRPARKLIVIGVTGTKGKSTTSRLIASVLEAGGFKVGMLTTVEFQIADKRWMNDRKMTMLGRGEIQKMLRAMARAGCRYAVVETSSEGILQYRHYGLHYDVAVFTNLGTEHSERHGGFENLKRDKGQLFAALSKYSHKIIGGKKVAKIIVANTDDANAAFFLNFTADKKYGFGMKEPGNSYLATGINPADLTSDEQGSHFTINDTPHQSSDDSLHGAGQARYTIRLLGAFNVYNALAAIAVGESQGLSKAQMAVGLKSVTGVPGRMEFVAAGQPFKIVVDYAHEPLSFTALFSALRQSVGPGGKLIAVVGGDGGGRDVAKRQLMGKIAGQLAEVVVVTDVDYYDDDPKIIAQMVAGGAREGGKRDGLDLFVVEGRRAGLAKAFSLAKAGDVVVLTAKGCEQFIMGPHGQRIPWNDSRVARELVVELSL